MLIGYARVSTVDQDLALQTNALTKAGCEKLFTDKASGAKANRPGLAEALTFVRAGDTLVIWKLDRLGRSIQGLIELAADLWRSIGDEEHELERGRRVAPSGRLQRLGEPLLERLGLIDLTGIHWVIVGGEAGPKARPMKLEWLTDIQDQCTRADVAFFFKQWGRWGVDGERRSKRSNGRELHGRTWDEMPELAIAG